MTTELLEIQPRELKFVYELKKQSSCSVRLFNNSNNYVAFKVKTTSPKKYCVRPNVGIVKPKSTSEFLVIMQAPRSPSPDITCKDKFLVQSSIVPFGTTDEDITPNMFLKDDGKYVEEKKLKVILVSPPNSPVLSPIDGTLKSEPKDEVSTLKTPSRVENRKEKDPGNVENIEVPNGAENIIKVPSGGENVRDKIPSQLETVKEDVLNEAKNLSPTHRHSEYSEEYTKPNEKTEAKDVDMKALKDAEDKYVKDMEEMKLKISLLESKLAKAESTITKLTEEKKSSAQEGKRLRQELAMLRSKKGVKRVQTGFPLLFVCMVALISFVLGFRRC